MSPLSTKVEFCRLYPKKLNYLFLAVFAFFSRFCYAKTAFSYSPDILSPCTPDVTMVKKMLKSVSEKMICGHHFEVWKCVSKTPPPASKKSIESREETHQPPHVVCSIRSNESMWSGTGQITWSNHVVGVENHTSFLPPQVLYCNSSSSGCQGPLKTKINAQNLIRSKQRKSDLDFRWSNWQNEQRML